MSLQLEYEMRLNEAENPKQVDAISFEIRSDNRLTNRDRNTLFIVCANRRNELSGKDGRESGVAVQHGGIRAAAEPSGRKYPADAAASPVPANPGDGVLSIPTPPAAGELSLSEAKELWDKFQAFKMAVIARGDYDEINGKKDLNRSGWSKIGTAFGISVEILEETITEPRDGHDTYVSFKVRASKGNRYADNIGSCEASEIEGKEPTFHLIRTKAYTRAMKRAIADLVGGAETE